MNENMLPVGTLLRGEAYEIEKQLASGGFGNTYVVWNRNFRVKQAMKEFFMKEINLRDGSDVTVSIPGKKATFESQRSKFMKEAQRLWELNSPHIIKVHDLFEENGTVYYVMDLIDGQSLSDIVKENGSMNEAKAMNIFHQVLDALSVVHHQKPMMLHLDIKPSNIMLDKRDYAYLIDFGSSKQVDTDNNMTSSAFTLTRGYAPPELIDGNKNRIGPWTDLYELGATLYHILTGKQPPTVSEITEDGENVFSFSPATTENTRKLILWLMTVSRERRPKSVDELRKVCGYDAKDTHETGDNKPHNIHGMDDDETVYDNEHSGHTSYKATHEKVKQQPIKPATGSQKPAKPNPHMALAILSTILCCPFGIAALISASKVESLYLDKDYEGAQEMSKSVTKWSIWAIALWGGFTILAIFFFLIIVIAES